MCHKTIQMKDPNDIVVDIDAGISSLIQSIWDREFITDGSCEEIEPGWFWLKFPDIAVGRRFISEVAERIRVHYPDVHVNQSHEDYLCIRAHGIPGINTTTPPWKIMFPYYGGLSFWIPLSDLPRLERILS